MSVTALSAKRGQQRVSQKGSGRSGVFYEGGWSNLKTTQKEALPENLWVVSECQLADPRRRTGSSSLFRLFFQGFTPLGECASNRSRETPSSHLRCFSHLGMVDTPEPTRRKRPRQNHEKKGWTEKRNPSSPVGLTSFAHQEPTDSSEEAQRKTRPPVYVPSKD